MSLHTNPIAPKETGIRLLVTALFAVITGLLVVLLGLITLFMVGWTLVTRRPPTDDVRCFANRVISYWYRVLRYLTYNEAMIPFPFSALPHELEPSEPFPQRQKAEMTTALQEHTLQSS
jgi:hypothetical protein